MSIDPFRKATAEAAMLAIDELLEILNDAHGYLAHGAYLAAIGTLLRFDDAAEDLKAAIRLHTSANRRQP